MATRHEKFIEQQKKRAADIRSSALSGTLTAKPVETQSVTSRADKFRQRQAESVASSASTSPSSGTPMTELLKETGILLGDPRQSELARAIRNEPMAAQQYKQATGIDVNQTKEKKGKGKIEKALDGFNAFTDRLQSATTFGISDLVDDLFIKIGPKSYSDQLKEEKERAKNVKGGVAADVLGSLVSGQASYKAAGALLDPAIKNLPNLAQGLIRGGAAGGAFELPRQASQEIAERFGGDQQSVTQRLKNVGLSAALGGLTDFGIGAGGQAAARIKNPILGKAIGGGIGVGSLGAALGTAKEIQQSASGEQQSLGGRLADIGKYAAAGAGLGFGGGSVVAKFMRNKGVPEETISEVLALPEGRGTIRQASAAERSSVPSGTDPIINPSDFTPEPLALPQGNTVGPTVARRSSPVNIYRQKFENLISEAQKREFSPGREDIELENLWSQMAGRNDPSLNELIDLAYPKRTNVPKKGMIGAARANQEMREVAGVGNPVKSSAPQVFNDAAAPTKILGRKGTTGTASEGTIRSNTLTREQQIMNKVNAKEPLTQADIEFAQSPDFDQSKLFPESAPTRSTYVKPEVKPEPVKVTPKKEVGLAPKKKITTEVKKVPKLSTTVEKRTPGIRSNYKTIENSGNISLELKRKVESSNYKTYTIFTDAEANRLANENVKNIELAESKFMNNKYEGKESIATGYRISQEFDRLANATNDPDLKEALLGRALAALDKTTADLTKFGQGSQAGSLIKRMSPEGQLQNLIRKAKANGLEVSVADSAKFKQEAKKMIDNSDAGIRENEVADILSRLEKGGANADDIKILGDYLKSAEGKINVKPVKDKLPKELKDTRKRDKVVSFLEAQEAAAQARINKRRGRLNSMPVDEWIDYSIVIAAKVGKGIIKAETYAEDLVKLFGEDIRPIARQVFEKAQELVSSVTKGSIEGDFIKADNAFKRITGQSSMNQQERLVEKYVAANPQVTPRDIESLRKLSKSLTDLRGLEHTKADIEMQKILNSYEKSSINDKINAVRYIAMLFNDATQAINALSGPIMATWGSTIDVLGSMMDIAMSKTLKIPRTTTLYGTNPLRFMANYFKYSKVGGRAGWEGVNPGGIQGTNEIRGLAFKSKKNPLGLAERALGAVAKGADYATYRTVYDSELQKQGFLDALDNGIKRSNKEGIKRHVRKFMNDPPIEAMEQADRIGKNTTFQRNDSVGGKTANWINSAPKGVRAGVNAVVPFVRTPLNIATTAVTATPVGIFKGLFQLSSLSKASQREAIRTLSMGIVGTGGVTSLGYYLSSIGIITGANDTGNKDVNSINEQAGRGKYRFNTSAMKRYMMAMINGEGADAAEKAAKYKKGDHAFDYNKLQPLAFPLALGAGFQEKKGNLPARFGAAGSDAFGSLFGMSSLKGIQDTFQPQFTGSQGDKAINVVNRVIESYFKSFSPSMLAQEARRQDPIQRKTSYNEGLKKDLSTYYKSRIPGLSQSLPASKDTLGNTKLNPPGFAGQHLNPYKSEVANYSVAAEYIADLIDRTGDQSIAPAAPQKYIEGYNSNDEKEKITLPIKRYEQLQEEMGAEISRRIIEIETDDDTEAIELIKEIYSDVKEEQREKLRDEFNLYSK